MKTKSIRFSLNQLVVLPLICLGVIMLAVSIPVVYSAITAETEEGLKNLSYALLEKCNVMGEGDYSVENDTLYKGENPIGKDNYVVDSVKEISGIDATIFWADTRMLTTIRLESGERAVGTKASGEVLDKVLIEGKEYFSSHVHVDNTYYYGYYIPMKNSDNTIVGMVFVGKNRERVMTTIFHVILRVSFVLVVVMAAALGISLRYAGGMVDSLRGTKAFLENVSQGDLECEIDNRILERRDEIGEMGRFARMLQKSILSLIGTDSLTGLYNRRSCNEMLEKAIAEYKKEGKEFAVVIGDIDGFKWFNDTYGHLAGDQVLKRVSKVMQEYIQGKGSVFRWGGEEFLIIYKGENPLDEMEELLEKIRNCKIEYKEQTMQVTMTWGISRYRQDDTIESVLKRADERLYYGKANGKNQVVASESM